MGLGRVLVGAFAPMGGALSPSLPAAAVEAGLQDSRRGRLQKGAGWAAWALGEAVQMDTGGGTSRILEQGRLSEAHLFQWEACEGV